MRFTKISASGNDFLLFHTFIKRNFSELAKRVCHRQNGIGADGLIVLLPSSTADFKWDFYNSDGSTASMCGNGSRAAAYYAVENALAPQNMSFETLAGLITVQTNGDVVKSKLTPFELLKTTPDFKIYDTGVPHIVRRVQDLSAFSTSAARELRQKYDANVNFYTFDGSAIRLRTYERGVEDETLACGTGMAACFLDCFNMQEGAANVIPKSGETLELSLDGGSLYLKGKVSKIADFFLQV